MWNYHPTRTLRQRKVRTMAKKKTDVVESKKFQTVKRYYDNKLWGKKQVKNAVVKAWITEAEYELITGEAYVSE